MQKYPLPRLLDIDIDISGPTPDHKELPALDILNTAEIPREDKRPAHGNSILEEYPFTSLILGDPFKPFNL